MSEMGQSRRLKHLAATSAIILNADIRLPCNICRNGNGAQHFRDSRPLRGKFGYCCCSFERDGPRRCAALPPRRVFSLFMRRRSSASMVTTRIIDGSNLIRDSSDGLQKLKSATALSEVCLGVISDVLSARQLLPLWLQFQTYCCLAANGVQGQ
jgi:hypothetical protein